MEAAQEISLMPASNDKTADALDRLTVALYRVGAALSQSVAFSGLKMGEIAEEIRDK
jgi:hypothetical protein